MSERRALHAYLSDAAHDSWHDTAAAHGVSASALLEALAPELAALPNLRRVVSVARQVDASRRRRPR